MGALFAREAHHAPAKLFLTQVAEARSVIVFNQVLELELRETRLQATALGTLPPRLEAAAA